MGSDISQQRFAEAKKLYVEGDYKKALLHLRKLNEQHPDVFNIQLPIIQCLQHLGKINEVKALHKRMKGVYLDEKHQMKLDKVGRWILRTEGKTVIVESNKKDEQIESEFENNIEDRIEDVPVEQVKETGAEKIVQEENKVDIAPQEPVPAQNPQAEVRATKIEKKRHPVLRKILISCEVIFIVLVGSVVMYLLSTKTARVLPEFTANVIMEVNDTQITGKLYLKNADTFRMEIMDQVFIAQEGQVRKILTAEEKYINVNPSDVERYNPLVGLSNFGDWVRINNAKKVGREKLQGFVCDIYQSDVEATENEPAMSTKVWYCRQIKFPLKSENTATGVQDNVPVTLGKVSVTLEDIQTEEALPEKMFEIPSVYAEYVKKKEKNPNPEKLDALPDNMEKFLQGGDPAALLQQFQ